MSYDAKTNTIWTFDGTEHDFLSNFHVGFPIQYDGREWPTSEHAYAAMKTLDRRVQEYIRRSASPGIAKAAGRRVTIRADWDAVKYNIMLDIVRAKFAQHPSLRQQLIATAPAWLEEGNTWNDRIWGVCPPRSGKGQNWLGQILMQVRDELSGAAS